MPNSNRRLRGFTLIELLAVMLIVAAALAIAAPSLRGFFASQRMIDQSRNALMLMNRARMLAVNEGVVYRFNFDNAEGEYWLSFQDGSVFVELVDDFGERFTLADDSMIEWAGIDGEAVEQGEIHFYPSGRVDPGTLRIFNEDDEQMVLHCPSATEMYRVYKREKRELLGIE